MGDSQYIVECNQPEHQKMDLVYNVSPMKHPIHSLDCNCGIEMPSKGMTLMVTVRRWGLVSEGYGGIGWVVRGK